MGKTFAFPLSYAQEQLWFFHQLQPDSSAYNIPFATRLSGPLKVPVLELSLNEIIERHEILRTTFRTVDEQPVQVVAPSLKLDLLTVDLREVSAVEQENEVQRLSIEEARKPFDLAQGPLLRVILLQLDEGEHVFLFTIHHIVSDGWSMSVFFRELSTLYAAHIKGEVCPLPPLPIQYADFAIWQREWLNGEVLDSQLNYWRRQLAGASVLLDLPSDRPRPPAQTFQGSTETFQLDFDLTKNLKALSRESGTTLFMILLAAFKTLVFRYVGQPDIIIGSPAANRIRSEVEPLVGFFVNTLALRSDLSDNPSFRDLLKRVRGTVIDAQAHQDLPFEKLVEELQPERSLSHNPIFQVTFALQNTPQQTLKFPNLATSNLEVANTTTKFDLSLSLEERGRGLWGAFEFSTDLFEKPTITSMIGHYQTLLEGVVANPDQKLSELPLLTSGEKHRLLAEWNDTETAYPTAKCIHELFEEQVDKAPGAVAVVFEDKQLTYKELNDKANQLARYLRKLGVGPEVLVGICLERSLEMVVGLLGILKAGGAYVPLDPNYPKERLTFMLEDSQAPVLLTQRWIESRLPSHHATRVYLDADWPTIAQERAENGASSTTAGNLAYVIYTSGSTGKPKGVMITHQAICNRLCWMQATYRLDEEDRVLQKTPFSFDVSVWEFFCSLLSGAKLVIAKPGGHQDSTYLADLIVEQGITILHFVPSMLQVFIEQRGVERCTSLRQVICSGEALPFDLQERFFGRLDAQLDNLYGPTEAAVDVTRWSCVPCSELKLVPIGRPIANTRIYILDKHLRPVPVGVPGELHLAGVQLARGYLNRMDLTEEKFIHHSVDGLETMRLYRTGDQARYLPDGSIEFLGRIDHQVKVRGLRIEPGEIEAMLETHPEVRQAVVLAREDSPGDRRLVAYLVAAQSDTSMSIDELRGFLREWLPEYMLPATFVTMDTMPVTTNGKIDRRALPVPNSTRCELESGFTPRDPIEEALVIIWLDVLGVDNIGIHDNFFELGGHSLKATQVSTRIRDYFGIQVPLREIFKVPTVAGLANAVEEAILVEQEKLTEDDARALFNTHTDNIES
jgi:amino acid adenylation domain-containing protein